MVIIWQHVHKLKHYVVHLKLIYCYMSYMSIISQFLKNQHIEKGLDWQKPSPSEEVRCEPEAHTASMNKTETAPQV